MKLQDKEKKRMQCHLENRDKQIVLLQNKSSLSQTKLFEAADKMLTAQKQSDKL